jgi:hypothetical protein
MIGLRPREERRVKTHDYEYAFRGYWDTTPQGRCRVRVLEEPGKPPILILTELAANPSTSVTNLAEHLVPELIARHLPHRFETIDEPPAIVVEHHEPWPGVRHGRRSKATYDLVTFQSWRPQMGWTSSGQERITLGDPEWRHMPADEVRDLLGDGARDLPESRETAEDRGAPD